MDLRENWENQDEIMDMLSMIISRLSCTKQSNFCNSNIFVYKNNEIDNIPEFYPSMLVWFKIITHEDELEKYRENTEIKNHLWKLKTFLKNGCQIYLSFITDTITGYYVVADLMKYKPYLYNYHPIFNIEPSYFIFYCRTFNKYQNNGIYKYILINICRNLIINHKSVFISTDLTNVFSQRGIENAGFKKIGTLRHTQFFQLILLSEFIDISK